ncbi:MAG: ATP synthase subunit I [Desulfuromonadaceae bacterium]|nr:ATP synthase subunit I [Desulfuromonadaceae bacterium]
MTGTDLTGLGMALAAGAALGAGYFAGLWLTVCRLANTRTPYRFYSLSLLLRLMLVLAGFYLLASRGYEDLLAAGVGFLVSRQLWLMAKRSPRVQPVRDDKQDA